jgi:alkyl hydroperoxide reductase subunit AhpC
MRQLVGLRQLLPEGTLRSTTQIVAVSIDSHADSKQLITLIEEDGIPVDFPLLEDQDHKLIDRYGLLNPNGRGIPHPATYVIDMQGIVRWKFVEVDYATRPANEIILTELKALH